MKTAYPEDVPEWTPTKARRRPVELTGGEPEYRQHRTEAHDKAANYCLEAIADVNDFVGWLEASPDAPDQATAKAKSALQSLKGAFRLLAPGDTRLE